jgi:hypothetical protein
MKSIFLKAVVVSVTIFCSIHDLCAQQSKNVLLGKTYTKAASASNVSTLKFTSSNSGQSENVTTVLGKNYQVSLSFNYKIVGKKVTIIYENTSDKEDYNIDLISGKLISTHLEGYVDGKWGKVYWIEQK